MCMSQCAPIDPAGARSVWLKQRTIGYILVAITSVFAAVLCAPILQAGYNDAGDDPVHVAYEHELEDILQERGRLHGWSYLYGVGAPIFLFRPPGFYTVVVLLHRILFPWLPLFQVHNLTYLLAFALYPPAVYFMARRFELDPLPSGIAAAFSITAISPWGHTLDAYFGLGLAKQALAILMFPVGLGLLFPLVFRGRGVFLFPWVLAFLFFNHPYMAYELVLAGGVLLLLRAARPVMALAAGGRLALAGAVSAGMVAVYVIPMFSSPEIARTTPFSSTWRHGFEVVCSTTVRTVDS